MSDNIKERLRPRGDGAAYADNSSGSESQEESQTAGLIRQESQASQTSQTSHISHTGLSQDMERAVIINEDENGVEQALVVPSLSYGTVCVVHRDAHRKMKIVKPFAVQNTFYAFPKDADEEMKAKINTKIEAVVQNFTLQNYDTKVVRFGLPFAVEEVCNISAGYNMTPKRMVAVAQASVASKGKKRKHQSSSESSENEAEDDEEEEQTSPAKTSSSSKTPNKQARN